MITLHPPKCYEFFIQFRVMRPRTDGQRPVWTKWEDHPDIHRPLRVTKDSQYVKVMVRAAKLLRTWKKMDESKTLQIRLVRKQLNVITCT